LIESGCSINTSSMICVNEFTTNFLYEKNRRASPTVFGLTYNEQLELFNHNTKITHLTVFVGITRRWRLVPLHTYPHTGRTWYSIGWY